jgi:dGTPase
MTQLMIAPYKVLKTSGREFPEKSDPTRTEFQRDRDRIIHSKAFRRLSGKTQVFVATYGDHFRDRLTHTLEVAQVARDLARSLRLNEDCCEAIALAHDLGHTPFGHAGEHTLNEIMEKFGRRFEHNEQSQRVVEHLEKLFPNFDGLNLTAEVREGLAKHQTLYDQRTKRIKEKTLEAQVVDIADEIAYHNHDLDDGLRSELFTLRDLHRLAVWREAVEAVFKKYGEIRDAVVFRHRIISQLISLMISDVFETAMKNLARRRFHHAVRFSPSFQKKIIELRKFLWYRMYQSPQVLKHSRRGQKILKKLFWHFYKNPALMPKRFYERIGKPDPLEVIVKDYVAGCTDIYAEQLL